MSTFDTVFNEQMRPVFVDTPDVVHRRLNAVYPSEWSKVCIGETGQVVSIPLYLHRDRLEKIEKLVWDLLEAKDRPMYQRNPKTLESHVQRVIVQLIRIAQGD